METNSSNGPSSFQAPTELVPHEVFTIFVQTLLYGVRPTAIVLGLFSNSLNILVFYKMGLKDSVNISFFALSLSDGTYLTLSSVSAVCDILFLANLGRHVTWIIHPSVILLFIYWYAVIFYDTSMLITVFIALVRCCCVAIPLKFKGVFTRSRTVVCIVVITVSTVLTRIPTLITQEIVAQYDVINNRTVYRLRYTADRPQAIELNDIMNRTAIWWIAITTMFVCVVVLATKLRAASKFRKSHDRGATSQTSRDDRVVKMVILVTVLFLVLSLPFMLYSAVRRLVPKFNEVKGYTKLFSLVTMVTWALAYLNAALNAVVYYNTNSRYKAIVDAGVRAVFCGRAGEK
ncbi:melatonin receptor type 1A-like [Aplysia californica]|uniref:Melatonin receptor type 1A-like n=1 Tax=Aplysia californica TaxID=6500 RepID=A0ABM0K656_APLCA|nr:melatonin receptor type 1A-like [Aplysia californica]